MKPRPLIVAIEGPCCAGKTTLALHLNKAFSGRRACYVQDYSDYAGGGRFLPPALPLTVAEEERALWQLIGIEVERTRQARTAANDHSLILLDRSAHTLIAHCYGLDRLTGLDCSAVATTVVTTSSLVTWPEVILYLDIDDQTIWERNQGKFEQDSIFINPIFNQGFRQYFERLVGASRPRVVWLDAKSDARLLGEQAVHELSQVVTSEWRPGKAP